MQNLQVRLRSICIQNCTCLDSYNIKPKTKRIKFSSTHHAILHSINNSLNKATHFFKIYYRTKKNGSLIQNGASVTLTPAIVTHNKDQETAR
jgi:hypothetical protein